MLAGIHHIQLAAPRDGETQAREFYGELLGLLEIEKPPELKKRGGAWFELGNGQQLHIGVKENFVAPKKAHPALVVVNLNLLREKLNAAQYITNWRRRAFSNTCAKN